MQLVGENIRDLYSSEKDLPSIKDRVLLDTCLKLEIISNIVHQKLVLTSLKKRMNQIYNLNIIFKYVFKYGLVHPKHLSLNRSEEHTSELQSRFDLVCRLLLEKK